MMKRSTALHLVPVSLFDVAALEHWLGDMAAKGLHLKRLGQGIGYFAPGPARSVQYRMEPVAVKKAPPSDELLEAFSAGGWEYACRCLELFDIYRAEAGTPELHSDPVAQSYTYAGLRKRTRQNLLLAALATVLLAAIYAYSFLSGGMALSLVEQTGLTQLICIPLYLVFLLQSLASSRRVRRLLRNLEAGVPLSHRGNYRHRTGLFRLGYAVWIAAVLILILPPLYGWSVQWDKDLQDVTTPLPIVRLGELEDDPGFVYSDGAFGGSRSINRVQYRWGPMAPVQYRIDQWGEGAARPYLLAWYYRLSLPQLSGPLLRDLMAHSQAFYPADVQEELASTAFDQVIWTGGSSCQCLFARRGSQVIWVRYQGEQDLREHVEQFAASLDYAS